MERDCVLKTKRSSAAHKIKNQRRGPEHESAPVPPPLPDGHHEIGQLLISCPDRPGIVAAVSRFLFEQGANIIDSNQHSTDPTGGTFFIRVEFQLPGLEQRGPALERAFSPLALFQRLQTVPLPF